MRQIFSGKPGFGDTDGGDRAGEDEFSQVRFRRDVQDLLQPFDVGPPERGRIAQPGAGVDDAVVHHVAVVHRGAHRLGVEDIAVDPLHVEIVDPAGGTGAADEHANILTALDKPSGDMRAEGIRWPR